MEKLLQELRDLPFSLKEFDEEGKLTGTRNCEKGYPHPPLEEGTFILDICGKRSRPELEGLLEKARQSPGTWMSGVYHYAGGKGKHFYFLQKNEGDGYVVIDFPVTVPDVEIGQYETLIENVPGIDMFLLDKDHNALIVLGHEIKRNGWDTEAYPKGNIREILKGKLMDILGVLLPLAAKGTPVFREFSDSKKYFSLRLIPVFDGGFQVKYTIVFLQNATSAKRTEIRLRKSIRTVEEASKAKNAFISHMSHEIRTPLNAILGFAEQLEKTRLNKTQLKYLDILKNSSQHLLSIVNDVLTLSKFEAGKLHFDDYPFNIREVVQTIRSVVEMRFNKEDIEFRLLMDPALDIELVGDAGRLRQVLMNLVNNAMKFTFKGYVELKCALLKETEESVNVRFEVTDTGIGIPRQKTDLIFEPFKQLDSSLKRKYSGTGLGLTICKRLVESQGGTIGVDSEQGKGSTFFVELHFNKSEEKAKEKEQNLDDMKNARFSGKKVMIVDDDPINCLLAEIMLKNFGITPVVADGGEQAIKFYSKGSFDMILLDIQMPNVSGIDVVRHIRAMEKDQPVHTLVLAMTANVLKDDMERYLAEGMDGHLIKPFTEERLFYFLRRFLGETGPREKVRGKILNLENLLATTKGDDEFTLMMLNTFEQNTRSQVKKLNTAVKSGNFEETADVAHRMIPSCEHLGASELAGKFRALENMCRQPGPLPEEEIRKDADYIDQQIIKVMEELGELKKQYR